MLMLQISAARGPEECQIAARHVLRRLLREASAVRLTCELLEENSGPAGVLSAVVGIEGKGAEALAARWCGTIQWVCVSPLRPRHLRRNWFVGVQRLPVPRTLPAGEEIVFQACKASGKGGQHVNTTDSAVRAVHVASGLSVKVQGERSQHLNKKRAVELLAARLAEREATQTADHRHARNRLHGQIERGNPVRVFHGLEFREG